MSDEGLEQVTAATSRRVGMFSRHQIRTVPKAAFHKAEDQRLDSMVHG